jgi:hypothetical protein
MEALTKLFMDAYDRPARLTPALLTLAPIPVLIICLFGKAQIMGTSILSIATYCGAGYMLARVARNAGKKMQDQLFEKWGGAPTTQLLRHSNGHFDEHTKARYHGILSTGLGKAIPSVADEGSNPTQADELYRAATTWLLGQTRDTKRFPLVFKENVAFGFQRNALGMRWYGVAIASVCMLVGLICTGVLSTAQPFFSLAAITKMGPTEALTLAVSAAMLFSWLFLLTESAAKQAAFSFAERLIQSCDQLNKPSPMRAPKKKAQPSSPT